MAYVNPGNYRECLFYRQSAVIACRIHNNTNRWMMDSQPSDDFRIVVYDDHVATTAGEQSKLEELAFVLRLDHDAPSATTPIVLTASRNAAKGMPRIRAFHEPQDTQAICPPDEVAYAKSGLKPSGNTTYGTGMSSRFIIRWKPQEFLPARFFRIIVEEVARK